MSLHINSPGPQRASPYSGQIAAMIKLRRPRRIIGKERQKTHLAEQRERACKVPKPPIRHTEPTDLGRIDGAILSIQGVARLLFVNVDTVRRIPFSGLPYITGPGRRNLYLCKDVERYVRSKINEQFDVDKNLSERKRLIDSVVDSVRGCSS